MHPEADNEEGGTIRHTNVCHTNVQMYIGLCITCVAQKLRNGGKHCTNQSAKHFILISSRAVYGAGNGPDFPGAFSM